MARPYRYSDAEALDFVQTYSSEIPTLARYVYRHNPPWGVVVFPEGSDAEILVWYSDAGLVVIDMTGAPLVAAIDEATYTYPSDAAARELVVAVAEEAQAALGWIPDLGELESLAKATAVVLGLVVVARVVQVVR